MLVELGFLVFEMCGPINYPYPPQGVLLEILGGGVSKPKFVKENMNPNWNFQRDFRGEGVGWVGFLTKKTLWVGFGYCPVVFMIFVRRTVTRVKSKVTVTE